MASTAGAKMGTMRTAYVEPKRQMSCHSHWPASARALAGQRQTNPVRTDARSARRLPAAFEGRVRCTSGKPHVPRLTPKAKPEYAPGLTPDMRRTPD